MLVKKVGGVAKHVEMTTRYLHEIQPAADGSTLHFYLRMLLPLSSDWLRGNLPETFMLGISGKKTWFPVYDHLPIWNSRTFFSSGISRIYKYG